MWHGDELFKVNGYYCKKKQGTIEKLLEKLLILKDKYTKEKDPRAYGIKIILNTAYGICGNPSFKLLYDRIAASDCTWLGRQCIKYIRKRFKENGYTNLMSDTDSVAVLIPDNKTMEETKQFAIQFCNEIKNHQIFPWDLFTLKLEDEIKYFFFFKGNQPEKNENLNELDEDCKINKYKQLLKKNYIYVNKEGKLTIKNLGIRKKSNSMLSRKIFEDYLKPQIIETGTVKFSKAYLNNLIIKLLQEDITLAAMRHDVGSYEEYKDSSPTGLPAQIAQKYGSGIYMMIPNLKGVGVGKGKSYCAIQEFQELKLTIDDVDLSNVWNELEYFTKPVKTKNIFEFQ
jgi:DNA polymerase elongation subunit (family B)